MRYPITLIPGLPVTPNLNVGIHLTPVVPVAPTVATVAAGPPVVAGEPNSFWAFNPDTAAGDDTLVMVRDGNNTDVDRSVPPGAFVSNFDFTDNVFILAVAIVRDAPSGALIAWDIPLPTVASGVSPSITGDSLDGYDIYFDGPLQFSLRIIANKVMCMYEYPRSIGTGYPAWALDPMSLTPSIDGVPLRTLTLTVSALAFAGF
jgi:hypothetical protein